jgi:hypothetical protein
MCSPETSVLGWLALFLSPAARLPSMVVRDLSRIATQMAMDDASLLGSPNCADCAKTRVGRGMQVLLGMSSTCG